MNIEDFEKRYVTSVHFDEGAKSLSLKKILNTYVKL